MTPDCAFCGARGQARTGFAAMEARFPNGTLLRDAGTWHTCDACMIDLLLDRWEHLARRMAKAMAARRPDLFGRELPATHAAAMEVIGAFVEARIGAPHGYDVHLDIPEDAPPTLREGLARRALVEHLGACPCGARVTQPPRRERRRAERLGEPVISTIHHHPGCPADQDALDTALATWSATA